jgi:hypothetical protein
MQNVLKPQPIGMSLANFVAMWTWLFSACTAMLFLMWEPNFGLARLHDWRILYLTLAFVAGIIGGFGIALRSKKYEEMLQRYTVPRWLFALGAIVAIGTTASVYSLSID